jgi:hypothetical protein
LLGRRGVGRLIQDSYSDSDVLKETFFVNKENPKKIFR